MSIANTGLALFWAMALQASEPTTVETIRMPGAGLDLSSRNEVDNAIRLACDWLADRQNPHGAWGVSDNVSISSVALTALCAARQKKYSDNQTRAALWLKSTADRQLADIETHALRLLALSLTLPDSSVRSNLFASLVSKAKANTVISEATPATAELWHLATAAAGLRPAAEPCPSTFDSLRQIAEDWPPFPCANRQIWRTAKTINSGGRGMLACGQAYIDWRSETAVFLLGSQRRDLAGGGYWDAPDQDRQILETAWGVLALAEL
ncbi:MAG: prenyltransferase/squalene oxidase repeat-containing protein [Kiritimatiellae bacterium]|nr:prenyltransferase/squalene oxidase repeat-containing protein [Kiritimatiellia bacterium]